MAASKAGPGVPKDEMKEKEYAGTGFYVGVALLMMIAAAVIIFTAQNTAAVTVKWLAWEFQAPLVAIVLVAAFLAAALDEVVGWVWRRRRRQMMTERAELARLRTAADRAVPTESGGENTDTSSTGARRKDAGISARSSS